MGESGESMAAITVQMAMVAIVEAQDIAGGRGGNGSRRRRRGAWSGRGKPRPYKGCGDGLQAVDEPTVGGGTPIAGQQ